MELGSFHAGEFARTRGCRENQNAFCWERRDCRPASATPPATARAPRPARYILAIAVALMLAYLLIWLQLTPIDIGRSDFTSFYVGGTLLRSGHGATLYNQVLQQALHSRLIAPDREPNLPFVNPPPAALVVLPVTFLPLVTAFHLWSLIELGVLVLAVVLAVRSAPWPSATPLVWKIAAGAAGLASVGTWTLLLQAPRLS
jgi:hypothetical protein